MNHSDITASNQHELSILASEKRYKSLFDFMHDACVILEFNVEQNQYIIVEVNQAFEEIEGLSREKVLNKQLLQLFPSIEKSGLIAIINEVHHDGKKRHHKTFIYENEIVKRVHHNVLFNIDEDKIVIIYNDITSKYITNELLKKSEEKYRSLVENIHEALIVEDVNGKLGYVNDRFCKMFGYNENELKLLTLKDYTAPEWHEQILERHFARMNGKEVSTNFEYEGLRKDGTKIWIEARVNTLVEAGVITGTLSLEKDISERKAADAELKEYRENLEKMVNERTKELETKNMELESFNNLFIGREFRIKELRDQVKDLENQLAEYMR
ncbi:MAG: PAS domain S-box protein [Bacteroidetes bacterium]|nr:PAS domain S-box protein [Bacteroidota bacterium]